MKIVRAIIIALAVFGAIAAGASAAHADGPPPSGDGTYYDI